MADRKTAVPVCFFVGTYSASMAAECTSMGDWRGFVGAMTFTLLSIWSFYVVMWTDPPPKP
jgi:hypothetical protein